MTVTKLLSMMEVPFLNIEDVHVQRSLPNGGQIVDSIPCLQHSKASILQEAGITTEFLSPSSEKRIEDIVTLVNARPFWMEFGVFSSGLMKKDVLKCIMRTVLICLHFVIWHVKTCCFGKYCCEESL